MGTLPLPASIIQQSSLETDLDVLSFGRFDFSYRIPLKNAASLRDVNNNAIQTLSTSTMKERENVAGRERSLSKVHFSDDTDTLALSSARTGISSASIHEASTKCRSRSSGSRPRGLKNTLTLSSSSSKSLSDKEKDKLPLSTSMRARLEDVLAAYAPTSRSRQQLGNVERDSPGFGGLLRGHYRGSHNPWISMYLPRNRVMRAVAKLTVEKMSSLLEMTDSQLKMEREKEAYIKELHEILKTSADQDPEFAAVLDPTQKRGAAVSETIRTLVKKELAALLDVGQDKSFTTTTTTEERPVVVTPPSKVRAKKAQAALAVPVMSAEAKVKVIVAKAKAQAQGLNGAKPKSAIGKKGPGTLASEKNKSMSAAGYMIIPKTPVDISQNLTRLVIGPSAKSAPVITPKKAKVPKPKSFSTKKPAAKQAKAKQEEEKTVGAAPNDEIPPLTPKPTKKRVKKSASTSVSTSKPAAATKKGKDKNSAVVLAPITKALLTEAVKSSGTLLPSTKNEMSAVLQATNKFEELDQTAVPNDAAGKPGPELVKMKSKDSFAVLFKSNTSAKSIGETRLRPPALIMKPVAMKTVKKDSVGHVNVATSTTSTTSKSVASDSSIKKVTSKKAVKEKIPFTLPSMPGIKKEKKKAKSSVKPPKPVVAKSIKGGSKPSSVSLVKAHDFPSGQIPVPVPPVLSLT